MHFNPSSLPSLSGKVYIVTGGNAGIGKFTVLHLAQHGAKVYMGARSEEKASKAIEEIKKDVPNADIHFLSMDLMNFESVVAAAEDFKTKEKKLHGLVNNAGIMATPFAISGDGYEAQWQTNYLSHCLLTDLLLPVLSDTAAESKPGDVRIVCLTSNGHNFAPSPGIDFEDINQEKGGIWSRYGQSKLGNILHAQELSRRYGPSGSRKGAEIWTASVHPGSVDTDLNTKMEGWLNCAQPVLKFLQVYKSADEGSYGSLYAIASPHFNAEDSGHYFVPTAKRGSPSKKARQPKLAEELWNWTEAELKKKGFLAS